MGTSSTGVAYVDTMIYSSRINAVVEHGDKASKLRYNAHLSVSLTSPDMKYTQFYARSKGKRDIGK